MSDDIRKLREALERDGWRWIDGLTHVVCWVNTTTGDEGGGTEPMKLVKAKAICEVLNYCYPHVHHYPMPIRTEENT